MLEITGVHEIITDKQLIWFERILKWVPPRRRKRGRPIYIYIYTNNLVNPMNFATNVETEE